MPRHPSEGKSLSARVATARRLNDPEKLARAELDLGLYRLDVSIETTDLDAIGDDGRLALVERAVDRLLAERAAQGLPPRVVDVRVLSLVGTLLGSVETTSAAIAELSAGLGVEARS